MSASPTAFALLGTRLKPIHTKEKTTKRGCDHPLVEDAKFCPQCGKKMFITETIVHHDDVLDKLYNSWNMNREFLPAGWVMVSPNEETIKDYFIGFGLSVERYDNKPAKCADIPPIEVIKGALVALIPPQYDPLKNFRLWAIMDYR